MLNYPSPPRSDHELASGSVKTYHIPFISGKTDPIPDTPTEAIVHNLGYEPDLYIIKETTDGVMGYVQVNDVTASSIVLQANVSGVVVEYKILTR